MLQQKQGVLDASGLAHLEKRSLQFEGRAIGDPAKIEDVSDHRGYCLTVSLTLDEGARRFVAGALNRQQKCGFSGDILNLRSPMKREVPQPATVPQPSSEAVGGHRYVGGLVFALRSEERRVGKECRS